MDLWPACPAYHAGLGHDKGDDASSWECGGGSRGHAQRGPSLPSLTMTSLLATSSGHATQVQGQGQAGVGSWGPEGSPCFTQGPGPTEVHCGHDGSADRGPRWGQQLPPPTMESCLLGLLVLPGPGSPNRVAARALMQHKKTLSWNCSSKGQATGHHRPDGLDGNEARLYQQQHVEHDSHRESAAGQRSERVLEESEGSLRTAPRLKRGHGCGSPRAATSTSSNSKSRVASVLTSRARLGLEMELGVAPAEHLSGRSNCVRASSLPVT